MPSGAPVVPRGWCAGACLALAAFAATTISTAGAQAIVLRYGQSLSAQRSIFSLPVTVAEREGLFKREGLDFRVIIPQPGGADLMIAALHDDTVDVTHVATTFLVRAALAGSDAVAIAAEFNNPIYSLVARPDIKRFAAAHERRAAVTVYRYSGTASLDCPSSR